MSNVVRAQYFMTDIRDFAGVSAAWADRFAEQPHPLAAVQVPGPLPATGRSPDQRFLDLRPLGPAWDGSFVVEHAIGSPLEEE